MKRLFKQISQLNREAARCDDLAGQRFSQASISSAFQCDLMEQGHAYQLEGDRLRIRAAELLRCVPPVVCRRWCDES